jgi:molybdopterin biosynthesis enzyme
VPLDGHPLLCSALSFWRSNIQQRVGATAIVANKNAPGCVSSAKAGLACRAERSSRPGLQARPQAVAATPSLMQAARDKPGFPPAQAAAAVA